MKIVIDPEFRELLPRASEEELSRLRALLERDGCRDAIIVWKETGILLDGHKRKSICDAADIPMVVICIDLPDRNAALQWMIDNQLARRNLTAEQRAYYIGKDYLAAKKTHGDADRLLPSGQNVHLGKNRQKPPLSPEAPPKKTDELVAEKHGVNPRTVRRAADFAEAVDALPPEEKAAVISGKKKATTKPTCDRCQRIGKAVKGCPQCADLRVPPAKPVKSGTVKFDDRIIRPAIGKLLRLFNDRANALGLQKSAGWADIRKRMDELETAWNRWRLELEKKP